MALVTTGAPVWDPSAVSSAEQELVAILAPDTPYTKRLVYLPSSGHHINTLSAGPVDAPHLVVLHGWGAGAALFGANLPGLAAGHRVHLVDWLGFGASSHPHYSTDWSAERSESFFVDALEQWVEAMRGLEDPSFASPGLHIVGHSLGAFLAVSYALRHPSHVRNLILASPVGVPHAPLRKLPPPTAPLMKRLLFSAVFFLWERHWTPQIVLRALPAALGSALARWAVVRRFPTSNPATADVMSKYFYQICVAPPSGERSLSTVLESGAYARRPLMDKLPLLDSRLNVLFLYGDRDWMDASAGERVAEKMRAAGQPDRDIRIAKVSGAGHHLYFDNVDDFDAAVITACAAARMKEEVAMSVASSQ
jgi:pimeloyl-ACP methyl ester carboxylesterase